MDGAMFPAADGDVLGVAGDEVGEGVGDEVGDADVIAAARGGVTVAEVDEDVGLEVGDAVGLFVGGGTFWQTG